MGEQVDPELSIVVPAFNEEPRLARAAELLFDAVRTGAFDIDTTEVLVIDDGSRDGTAELARSLLARLPLLRVVRIPHAGKGAAVRTGIASALAPLVAFIDADMSIDPHQLPSFVSALADADLAIGSRALAGASGRDVSAWRALSGRAFNWFVNATAHLSVTDTQCGFKAFRTPVARLLFHYGLIDRYAFDVEILYSARRFGLRIAEVPVRWHHAAGSRIHPVRDPAVMLADMTRSARTWRWRRPVEALAVEPSANGTSPAVRCREVVGRRLPVIAGEGGGALVLMPLCSAGEVSELTRRLESAFSRPLQRRRLTAGELANRSPVPLFATPASSTAAPSPLPADARYH